MNLSLSFDLGINDAGGKLAIPNISVFLICTSLCFLKRTQESLWKFQPKLHQAQCLVSVHQLLAREQGGEKYWGDSDLCILWGF